MIPNIAHKLAEKLLRWWGKQKAPWLANEKEETEEGKRQGRKGRVTAEEALSLLAGFTRFSVGHPWWQKSQTLKWGGGMAAGISRFFFLLAIVSSLQKRSPPSLTMQKLKMKSDVLAHILRNKCLLLSASLQQPPVNRLTRYPRRESSY